MKKAMKIILAAAAVLTLLCCAAAARETAAIRGGIEEGDYVLRIPVAPEDAAAWLADDPQGEPVTLRGIRMEGGELVIAYAPVNEGECTVYLRHMAEGVCDRMHGFDLTVGPDSAIEVTGGSYAAAPDPDDLDPYLPGEWLQEENQFTVMDIVRDGDCWTVEIVSPMTQEARMLRATMRYDCDAEALVYHDGVMYDLPDTENPVASDLSGRLEWLGTEEAPQLAWISWDGAGDDREIVFDRAPDLPAWTYTGSDPLTEAITAFQLSEGIGEIYLTERGCVTIPAPVILKTDRTDEDHAAVYGNFWIMNYVRRGPVLVCISGGEEPAVYHLEKEGGVWHVTDREIAGDGDDYARDIVRFCNGDRKLEAAYFSAADVMLDPLKSVRTRFIRDYVDASGLPFTAYQDPYWDPVPLEQ